MLYYLLHINNVKSRVLSVNILKMCFYSKIYCFDLGNFLSDVELEFKRQKIGQQRSLPP